MQITLEGQLTASVSFYYRLLSIEVDEPGKTIRIQLPLKTTVVAGVTDGQVKTFITMFGLPGAFVIASGMILGAILLLSSAKFISNYSWSLIGSFPGVLIIVLTSRHGRSTYSVRCAVVKIMREHWLA